MTKCLDRHVIENRNNKRPEWRDRKKLFVHSNVWVAFTGSSANEVRTEWLNNIECVLEEFYGHIWKCSKCKIIIISTSFTNESNISIQLNSNIFKIHSLNEKHNEIIVALRLKRRNSCISLKSAAASPTHISWTFIPEKKNIFHSNMAELPMSAET